MLYRSSSSYWIHFSFGLYKLCAVSLHTSLPSKHLRGGCNSSSTNRFELRFCFLCRRCWNIPLGSHRLPSRFNELWATRPRLDYLSSKCLSYLTRMSHKWVNIDDVTKVQDAHWTHPLASALEVETGVWGTLILPRARIIKLNRAVISNETFVQNICAL